MNSLRLKTGIIKRDDYVQIGKEVAFGQDNKKESVGNRKVHVQVQKAQCLKKKAVHIEHIHDQELADMD